MLTCSPSQSMPFCEMPIASVSPPPSTPRTCGNARPPSIAVDRTLSRSIAAVTRLSALVMNLPCSIALARRSIASSRVATSRSTTISSSALNREMPVFGLSRSCGSETFFAASSSAAKSMRPQLEQVTRCCARRTCCPWAIGTCMPHTAQQPLVMAEMTIWFFLYRRP